MKVNNLPKSTLIENQKLVFEKKIYINRKPHLIEVTIRFDDECGNGKNSFAITANIYSSQKSQANKYWIMGGCLHKEIAKYYPALAYLIKWHGWSSKGYDFGTTNIIYYAKKGDLELARLLANWEEATKEQLMNKTALIARLPNQLRKLKRDIENLNLIY